MLPSLQRIGRHCIRLIEYSENTGLLGIIEYRSHIRSRIYEPDNHIRFFRFLPAARDALLLDEGLSCAHGYRPCR